MKKIRRNIFETNSSSVHAIVITTNNNIEIPKDLPPTIELGTTVDFGWEIVRYNDFPSKLQYLYNACESCETYKPKLDAFLSEVGIEIVDYAPGYIDHGYDTVDFLEFVFSDINNFKRYLFSPNSFIQTGNDNGCWEEVNEVVKQYSSDPRYDVFFKGN